MTTFLDDETFNTIARKLSDALNALHPKIGVWMGKGGGEQALFDELAEAAGGVSEEFEGGVTAYWNINDVMVLLQEASQADDERGKLEALIQRVVEIGPFLHADSIADVIYGKTANAERLSQLLKDCQESPKGRRSALD